MTDNFFQELWHLVREELALHPEIYTQLAQSSHRQTIALVIVLAAGLSQAIGQSFILFVNRVKPLRFVLCLGVAAVLFGFTYIFWAWSVWSVGHFILRHEELQLLSIMRWVALSYAPQLFGFLVALPYFGIPLSVLLSIWSLLILVAGLQTITSMTGWEAFACTSLGWLVWQVGQRTAGRPLMEIGRRLENLLAGTNLVRDRQSLAKVVRAGNLRVAQPIEFDWVNAVATQLRSKPIRRLLNFLTLPFVIVGVGLISIFLGWAPVWFLGLSKMGLKLTLVAISLIALSISIPLTHLEAMTWWAGWKETGPFNPGVPVRVPSPDTPIARYVIYLDGIGGLCLPTKSRSVLG
jgi:hypothetical protein